MNTKLKQDYENACHAYAEAFCKKHGYDYDPEDWVARHVGGILSVGDYFVDMETIRVDIDKNAPEDEFVKWFDYCTRVGHLSMDKSTPNFDNWMRGCPRMSDESLSELEKMKQNLEDAINQAEF
jgi:hypothetical protein